MELKKFTAKTTAHALKEVYSIFGSDAVIYQTNRKDSHVEIIAGNSNDYDLKNKISNYSTEQTAPSQSLLKMSNQLKMLESKFDHYISNSQLNSQSDYHHEISYIKSIGISDHSIQNFINLNSIKSSNRHEINKLVSSYIKNHLKISKIKFQMMSGIYSFVGMRGVGKTTSLIKMLNNLLKYFSNSQIDVISTDKDEIEVKSTLLYHCSKLNVTMNYFSDTEAMMNYINLNKARKIILIDTAGFSLGSKNEVILDSILSSNLIKKLLVIPGTCQFEDIKRIVLANQNELNNIIITKLDDVYSVFSPLSKLIDLDMSLSFCSDGPKVDESFFKPSHSNLVKYAFDGLDDNTISYQAESYEKSYTMNLIGRGLY